MKSKQPIMKFKSTYDLQCSLNEWVDRLYLQGWNIEAKLVDMRSFKSDLASNEYDLVRMKSEIRIGIIPEEENMGNDDCQELTLVHELLHLKFCLTDEMDTNMGGHFIHTQEHILIEQMARALLMAKYGFYKGWFREMEDLQSE